eukprot:5072513-Prymnesium_polylepis.1
MSPSSTCATSSTAIRPDVAQTIVGIVSLDSNRAGATLPPLRAHRRSDSSVATAHPPCPFTASSSR